MDILRQGGVVLVGIAAVSVIAWTLLLRGWSTLRERTLGGWDAIERAVKNLQQSRPIASQDLPHGEGNFVAQLLRSDIIQRRMDRSSFEAQIVPQLNSEAVMFRQMLRKVAVLAACMPLLGLLGTVLGMVETFSALTERGVANVDSLAGGISQALITTQAGLVMAVPVLLAIGLLGARIRRYLDTVNVLLKKIETAICDETKIAA